MDVECWHRKEDNLYVSKSHPLRAVTPCLAGWACYEKMGPMPDDPGVHRGVADYEGALEWLRGEQPHSLMPVEGKSVPPPNEASGQVVPGSARGRSCE